MTVSFAAQGGSPAKGWNEAQQKNAASASQPGGSPAHKVNLIVGQVYPVGFQKVVASQAQFEAAIKLYEQQMKVKFPDLPQFHKLLNTFNPEQIQRIKNLIVAGQELTFGIDGEIRYLGKLKTSLMIADVNNSQLKKQDIFIEEAEFVARLSSFNA